VIVARIDLSFVYCSVSDPHPPITKDLYVVEFVRHPGDLGVSLILRAESYQEAKLDAWRLFPEYRRAITRVCVRLLDYAQIDWQSGQSFVITRKMRPFIPPFRFDDPPRRNKTPMRQQGTE
jgi:hypothetical protein